MYKEKVYVKGVKVLVVFSINIYYADFHNSSVLLFAGNIGIS